MKLIFNIAMALVIGMVVGCKKYDDDYKSFLNDKETVYPGLIKKLGYRAGNLRTALFWSPSPDPSITKYVILWNNGANSMEVPATTHNPTDVVTAIVPSLNEYVYSFSIISYDKNGNKSIGVELNNVRVYGANYTATLLNRSYNATNPYQFLPNGDLQLNFNRRDTMNVSTTIRYTNMAGATATVELAANDNSIVVPNYKLNTPIQYRSSYEPELNAYDKFNVSEFADFPAIIKITESDKSLFREFFLPGDANSAYGWVLSHLWNNRMYKSSSDNPDEGFHTGGVGLPQAFTIDLGARMQLDNFRLWQRDNALYRVANLKRFEVWGSNSPNPNGSFDATWTKLQTFDSFKPSGPGAVTEADRTFARAGEKFTFPTGIPEVRYVRFRVLETWGNANYIHLTELSFFRSN